MSAQIRMYYLSFDALVDDERLNFDYRHGEELDSPPIML